MLKKGTQIIGRARARREDLTAENLEAIFGGQAWFRSLPKHIQIPVGLTLLWVLGWMLYAEWIKARAWEAAAAAGHPQPKQAILVTLATLVATVVLSELLRGKPDIEDARPAGIGDVQVTTATEGRPVPLLWGRVLIKGPNVVWWGDLSQQAITERIKTGLWSSTRVTTGFRYYLGMQWALCRGPDVVLKRILVGDKELWSGTATSGTRINIDEPAFFGGEDLGSGGIRCTLDFYGGETTQAVNGYLNDPSRQQIATAITPTAPRCTGTAHVVLRQYGDTAPTASMTGGYVGNSVNLKEWSFEVERFPATFSGQSAGNEKVATDDVNLANVAYELVTNTEWGFGQDAADVDVGVGSSFAKASASMLSESNGFAMLMDSAMLTDKFKKELERQMDGFLFQNPATGKWTIQLVRGPSDSDWGYSIGSVFQLTDDNRIDVRNLTRGTWEDTTNIVDLKYHKRADEYKESHAFASNMANAIILGDGSTDTPHPEPSEVFFPGVKRSALAANLAWREIRTQSIPLIRATFIVNQEAWDVVPGSVFAWTSAKEGYTQMAMRVTKVIPGTLEDPRIEVDAVQDVFRYAAASGGTPGDTKWSEPEVSLVAFPVDEQVAFEAPRAIQVRDPNYNGDTTESKVWCGARQQGLEVGFDIKQRNDPTSPSGLYVFAGDAVAFVKIGELDADLDAGTAIPTSAITVNPTPDSQTTLEEIFDETLTLEDLGAGLANLVMVGTEFMLVTSASLNGPDVDLENVYRGVLDSVQQNHSSGDPVYMIFVGGGLTDTSFPNTYYVDIELRMKSAAATFSGSVTDISLQMAQRARRPYPPGSVSYNGSSTRFNTPDLEGDGSGLNGVGFDVDWRRRRYDTTNELQELLADNTPDASTEYRVSVYVDPAGSNDLAYQSSWVTGTGPVTPTQAEVIVFGAAGTTLRIQIEVRHDVPEAADLEGRYELIHDVTPTSTRTSQFYLGGNLAPSIASNVYTVTSAGVHNVNIGAAFSTSNVQIRINGGSWNNIITAGNVTGATSALSISDTIELRHTFAETPDPQFVEIDDGVNPVAYGAFSQ